MLARQKGKSAGSPLNLVLSRLCDRGVRAPVAEFMPAMVDVVFRSGSHGSGLRHQDRRTTPYSRSQAMNILVMLEQCPICCEMTSREKLF